MTRFECDSCGRIMYCDMYKCPYCSRALKNAKYTNKLIPKRKTDEEILEYVIQNFPDARREKIKITEIIEESRKEGKETSIYFPYIWTDHQYINYYIEMDRPNTSIKYFGIKQFLIDKISLKQISDFLKFLGKENDMQTILICG